MKKSPSLRLPLILIVLALSLAGAAGAQEGRPFVLVESQPLDLGALTPSVATKAAPALSLREVAAPGEVLAPVSKAVPTKQSGCRAEPSSPAIGADIPQNYFGVPGPTTNPSLVGARQLLTSGPLNPIARTITLPLYRGRIQGTGERVWYIATDTTDLVNAEALGLNHSAKLAFAETGRGVRNAYLVGDELEFESGTVDFTPDHLVVPGPSATPFLPRICSTVITRPPGFDPIRLCSCSRSTDERFSRARLAIRRSSICAGMSLRFSTSRLNLVER